MSVSDPIADGITKIRNAFKRGHKSVNIAYSKLSEAIVEILDSENYINSYQILDRNPKKKRNRKMIFINLRYTNDGDSVIKDIQKVSKPGLKVYVNSKNIPSVYNNTGCAILSTNKGVIVDREARKLNVGGEYICKVW